MKPLLLALLAVGLTLTLTAPATLAQDPAPAPANSMQQRFYATLATAAKSAVPDKTRRVGGGGGGKFIDVLEDGAILVGFDLWQGDYAGNEIIRGIQPIYQTAEGRFPGGLHGEKTGRVIKVEAKDGYAVAAIEARSGDQVDAIRVLFWKIRYADVHLEAESPYRSDWIGGGGGHKARHPLSSNGNPVIGILGASGSGLDRLGLVYYERH